MPAVDPYGPMLPSPDGPYSRGAAVTPHDTNDLAVLPMALIAYTTAGTAAIVTAGGDTVSIYLPLGVIVKVRARIVKSTGTAAVGITALW